MAALCALAVAGCGGPAGEAPPADAAAGGETLAAADWGCPGCNLVLVSIDTLRADHLGAYGYGRDTSPTLDALAASGVLFERAYSASYHTADSHMSIFTGLYPSVHRVRNAKEAEAEPLQEGLPTLTTRLHDAGYRTVGFHGGGNVSATYGFDRGFERYEQVEDVAPAVAWLEQQPPDPDRPFFLFFHTYRVHDPYLPAPPNDTLYDPDYRGSVVGSTAELEALTGGSHDFAAVRKVYWERVDPSNPADLRHLVALYDGEIRQVDEEIGRLLAALDEHAPRTLVVLTSDHGEEFHEHGRFIHDQLYDELLHVPLIVRHPDLDGGRRIASPFSQVDLAPTLLDALGAPPLEPVQGVSRRPWLEGRVAGGTDPAFSEKVISRPERPFAPRNLSVIAGSLKVIATPRLGVEAYDLRSDPDELHDLGDTNPAVGRLLRRLREWKQANDRLARRLGTHQPRGAALGSETIEQLKALGYLE